MERVDGPCRGEPSPRKPLLIHCRHDATEPLTLVLPDSESFFEVPYFDMPNRYRELTEAFPSVIQIRPFQEFFMEIGTVAGR